MAEPVTCALAMWLATGRQASNVAGRTHDQVDVTQFRDARLFGNANKDKVAVRTEEADHLFQRQVLGVYTGQSDLS